MRKIYKTLTVLFVLLFSISTVNAKTLTERLADGHKLRLGDTSYDTFCFGAKEMEKHIVDAGGTLITDALYIDVLEHPIPEDAAVEWFDDKLASA